MKSFSPKLGAAIIILTSERGINRTALNKICFFSDVVAEMELGIPITDARYRKLPHGPVPNEMETTRASLVEWGYLEERVNSLPNFIEFYYSPTETLNREKMLADPTVGFTAAQIEILERCASTLGRLTAATLSDVSHQFEPWKSADMGAYLDLRFAAHELGLRDWLIKKGTLKQQHSNYQYTHDIAGANIHLT